MSKKILILRFSSIGDIVLTTPVVRAVKTQLDNAEVHYATKAQFQGLLTENPYVDKVHVLGDDIGALIEELRRENFDFVVDLHKNLRTWRIKSKLGVPYKSFEKLNWEKWLLVNFKINKMPNVHIVDRYLEAVAPLGVKKDTLGLDYFIPEKDEVDLEWLPVEYREKYVAFAIGGQHTTKQLPIDKIIELCDKINRPIVLLGGKEDVEAGDKVAQFFSRDGSDEALEEALFELNKKARVFNMCGKLNLNQSASVVKQAVAVFSHDTGMMHIAAAFRKKLFTIWGNTIPSFGMYPYATPFTVFENNSLSCRPCSKIGYNKCPKGHFKCMRDIKFDFYLPE